MAGSRAVTPEPSRSADRVFQRTPARSPLVAATLLALAISLSTHAEPWIDAGDSALRHDLQVLADAGVLTAPVLSWPLPWSDIVRDLSRLDDKTLAPVQAAAAARVRSRAGVEQRTGRVRLGYELAASYQPDPVRTFADIPREKGEAAVVADWMGERFAWKASARLVADADDGQEFRADGSYVAASLGNWMLSAGFLDRWWGPGWQGSLILSSNARPLPAIALDRNEARPFDLPVLRWLGPWRLSTFVGQLEGDRDYAHALLFGMRAEIRPIPSLQIAASRTAQLCGEDRPCGLDTFWDMFVGNDNDQPIEEQPGNQLGGFDVRWAWPGSRVPLALYVQAIGEDEAGFMPSKYLGLFGAEIWGDWSGRSWRLMAEYADTACDFINSEPEFGCAYTNVIYTSGYRYRGRVQGHPIDADGESIGLGAVLIEPAGVRWQLNARNVKLNRAGVAPGHTLADAPARLRDLALIREQSAAWGNITLSLGYAAVDQDSGVTQLDDGLRGFVSYSRELR
jgi:hypothetical protein